MLSSLIYEYNNTILLKGRWNFGGQLDMVGDVDPSIVEIVKEGNDIVLIFNVIEYRMLKSTKAEGMSQIRAYVSSI
jgi:hypothetical protein